MSWFDFHLDVSVHIGKPCASVFYHAPTYNIGHIWKFLRLESRVCCEEGMLHLHCVSCTGYLSDSGLISIVYSSHLRPSMGNRQFTFKSYRILSAISRAIFTQV